MLKRLWLNYQEIFIDLILVFILAVIFLGFLFHNFFTNPYYYLSADIAELYFPWFVYINKAVHMFQLPLLNRFWFGGSLPFAALESSLFYPPYLLAQILFDASNNFNNAYFWHFGMQIAHYILASISFYLLLRVGLKLERFASIFGAIIYACSGVFIGRFTHTVVILTLSWLPLLYLFYLLFVRQKKLIYALLTTVILIFIITSGHPQMIYYVFGLLCLAIIYFCFTTKDNSKKKLLGFSFLIIIFSLTITAPKLFLTFELAQNIVRTTAETTIKNLYNSLYPFYYLTLLVPYLFGKHFVGYWGSDYPWGNWENFIYIGIIPILFLPFSFLWKDRKKLWFFYLNLGLTVFLMLGKYQWISAFVNKISPFADSFTMISKLTNFFHFFLVIIVSIGLNSILQLKSKAKSLIPFLIYFIFVAIILFTIKSSFAGVLQFSNREAPTFQALNFITANILQARFIFIFSLVTVVLYLILKSEKILYLMILIYALDIFISAGNFNPIEASPGPPSQYFGKNPIISALQKDTSIFRVDNLWPRNVNMIQEVESTYGYHTIETQVYHQMMSYYNFQNRNILDMMNIKYFISDKDLSKIPGFTNVMPNLWENKNVLPRLFYVPTYRTVSTNTEMIQAITSNNYNPRLEVALYQKDIANLAGPKKISINKSFNYDNVKINRYHQGLLEADVNLPEAGFLIFSQFQYPGWTAQIDGQKTNLLPANLSFYALPIDKGSHKVKIYYYSKPLFYGILISLLGILVIVFSLIHSNYRKYYFRPLK